MTKTINMLNKKFGKLKIIKKSDKKIRGCVFWVCLCDCGKETEVRGTSLRYGNTTTCGCLQKEAQRARLTTHGKSDNRLYDVWQSMCARCYNNKDLNFSYYGERGITVCSKWKNSPSSFISFCEGNGWEKGLQIDRIDNNGNYSPDNVRFVTARKNVLNRRNLQKNNKSGFAGIHWNRKANKWQASIGVRGRLFHLGLHETKDQALSSRNEYIIENKLRKEYKLQ